MPDPKANPQRHRTIESLVKANLGSGRLNIEIRTKTDMRYSAGRSAGESVQVLNETGTAVPISLDRDQIFGADVFSQNEIEEIASSPTAQLALLDRFQEHEAGTIARELEQLRRDLEQSSIDLRRLDQEIDDLRGKASELSVIEEKLKGVAEVGGPDAARINAAHTAKSARAKEEKIPGLILAAGQRATRDIAASVGALRATVDAHLDTAVREGVNRDVFQPLAIDVQTYTRALDSALDAVMVASHNLTDRVKAHAVVLAERHALQEAEYRSVVSESEEQGGRAAERNALQALQATALAASKEQQAREAHRGELAKRRGELLKRVSELRDRRYLLRKRVAERLSQQFTSIRVTVAQATDLQQYRDLVADALKGAGVKQGVVAERLAQVFLPTELSQVAASNDHKAVMERASFEEERARKIVNVLRTSGATYAIETSPILAREGLNSSLS